MILNTDFSSVKSAITVDALTGSTVTITNGTVTKSSLVADASVCFDRLLPGDWTVSGAMGNEKTPSVKIALGRNEHRYVNLRFRIQNVPSQSGSLTYSGGEQSPSWSGYDPAKLSLSGTTKAVNSGTYWAVFTPKHGYAWSDGSTEAKTVAWSIGSAVIGSAPRQRGSLTYNGGTQRPEWDNYDPAKLKITGATSGVAAGGYWVTFTPIAGYTWSDGTTDGASVRWTIERAEIASVPSQMGSLTYNGSRQYPSWDHYDSGQLTMAGLTSGTNADSYAATFTPTENYRWRDGTTDAKTVYWYIERAAIGAVPSQSGSLTFNGYSQSPTWNNYYTAQVTISGSTSGINAGSYTAAFTPTSNYKWSDGSTEAMNVTWRINKAAGKLTLSVSGITFSSAGSTHTIQVTRYGDGKITAVSSAPWVATVSVEGDFVFVTSVAAGSSVITISVAEGTNHLAPASKTCAVTVETRMYLYKTGDEYTDVTGGWAKVVGYDESTLEKRSTELRYSFTSTYDIYGFTTVKPIDLSGYSTLHVKCSSSVNFPDAVYFGVDDVRGEYADYITAKADVGNAVTQERAIDISNINKKMYVGLFICLTTYYAGTNLSFTEVWLE